MSSTRIIQNPDVFRTNIRNKLNAILENEKHSLNLEKGIYNYALKEATTRKVLKSGIILILYKFILTVYEVYIVI